MGEFNLQVSYIRVSTSDLDRARQFYEDILGLPLITQNFENG
jgi:catechol 2,3-dioxygenase-like lactoylglutathione lyase family enzyme